MRERRRYLDPSQLPAGVGRSRGRLGSIYVSDRKVYDGEVWTVTYLLFRLCTSTRPFHNNILLRLCIRGERECDARERGALN